MARPSKLTDETQAQIVALIRAGNPVEVAAEAAGISQASFYGWLKRAEREAAKRSPTKAGAPFIAFREAVAQARAESEALLVARIAKAAGGGSWNAAAWLLERRWPERWAKLIEKEQTPGATQAVEPEDRFAKLDELAPRREARTPARS